MNMKKGLWLLLFLCLWMPLVAAAENDTEESKIDQAFQCLETTLNNKTVSTLSLQESLFSILALGDNTRAVQKLDSENRSVTTNQTCWPRASCTVKETAQALLAYQTLGRNTDKIENYLLSKSGPTTGLNWFILIDIENRAAASCRLQYGSVERTIAIDNEMRLSGDLSGTCLSIVPTGYWLEISQSCIDRSYEISCDQDFLTTLLYTQEESDTIFVSPNTHSAPLNGFTNETVISRCFKESATSECTYEGTLWGALALDEAGLSVANYLPYLAAFSTEGEEYFPAAFLYKLTAGQDYYTDLIQQQRSNSYWESTGSIYKKFYDTALALWSLQGTTAPEVLNAKNHLLETQGANGCWDNTNLRNTAFILYAGWPEFAPSGGFGGSQPGPIESCRAASPAYTCTSSLLQCSSAGGEILSNYDCEGSLYCCSVTPEQATCAELQGEVCSFSEECSGTPQDSADGQCCLGSCMPITTPLTTECEDNGGICSITACDADVEEQTQDACFSPGELCCMPLQTDSDEGGSAMIWIILLLLIALVVAGIIFRKKLRLLLFKSRRAKTPASSSPLTMRRPSFPPSSPPQTMMRTQAQTARRQPTRVDKEMEETLRKLREMSK